MVFKVIKKIFSWLVDVPEPDRASGTEIAKAATDKYIPKIYGQVKKHQGTIIFKSTTDLSNNNIPNELLHIIIVWSEAVQSIDTVYLDDVDISTDSPLFVVGSNRYAHAVNFPNGMGTYADAELVNAGWRINDRVDGKACTYIRLQYANGENLLTAEPKITADITGTTFSNPALCLKDYLESNVYGKGLSSSQIDLTALSAVQTYCDTTVETYAGSGVNRTLFTCNTAIDTSKSVFDNTNKLLKSFRGLMPVIDGKLKPIVEKEDATVSIPILEDDIIQIGAVTNSNKSNRYNQVIVEYVDAEENGTPQEAVYPEKDSATEAAWLAADNGVRLDKKITLDTCNNYYEALNYAKIYALISREQLKTEITLDIWASIYEVGDIVEVTHSQLGWNSKPFRIDATSQESDKVVLSIREHQPYIYANDNNIIKPAIPDSSNAVTLPDAPTALTVIDFYNSLKQLEVTWSGTANRYDVTVKDSNGVVVDNRIVSQKKYIARNYEFDTYTIEVRALNSLNMRSVVASTTFAIDENLKDFTWIVYAEDANGLNASLTDSASKTHIGIKGGQDVALTNISQITGVQFGYFDKPTGGTAGASGKSIYTVSVFQRATTPPSKPADNSASYNFDTDVLTPPSGWSVSIPTGTNPIYVTSTTFSVTGATGTDSTCTFTDVALLAESGEDGQTGTSYREISIYRRSSSPLGAPTGGSYNFTTDVLTPPTNWAFVPPEGSDPVYVSRGVASVPGNTGTDSSITWSTPTLFVKDGEDGTSVTITNTSTSNGQTTITFSDGNNIVINDGNDGDAAPIPIITDNGLTITIDNQVGQVATIKKPDLNLCSQELWTAGSGSQPGIDGNNFTQYGISSENAIALREGVFGNPSLTWLVRGVDTVSDADGGYTKTVTVDPNKNYLSFVYFRKTSSTNSGGLHHGPQNSTVVEAVGTGGLNDLTNPFYSIMSASLCEQNEWYVSIGYLTANNGTLVNSDTAGVYKLSTGEKVRDAVSFRLSSGNLTQQRVLFFGSTNTTTAFEIDRPGFYEITGREPNVKTIVGGLDGYTPQLGIDYFDGVSGEYVSFIYRNASAKPSTPTGGNFNGVTETFPSGWTDSPQDFSLPNKRWVSTRRYEHNPRTNIWSAVGAWSAPSLQAEIGEKGEDGTSVSITNTSTSGKDTTITFSDGTSIVVSDGNDGLSAPIPIITDNQNGTYTIDNQDGDVVTFSDGEDGYTPQLNIDYFNGVSGDYVSFIFLNASTRPSTPTTGTFNGTTETFPSGWSDNPTDYTPPNKRWMSKRVYEHNPVTDTWSVKDNWTAPSLQAEKGDTGNEGPQGERGITADAIVSVKNQRWGFAGSAHGWQERPGSTLTQNQTSITINVVSNGDTGIQLDNLGTVPNSQPINGSKYFAVRARVRTLSASHSTNAEFYYRTSSHSFSGSFVKSINVEYVQNEWTYLVFDMRELNDPNNTDDWITSTITGLRLDFANANSLGKQYEIDGIIVGEYSAGELNPTGQAINHLVANYQNPLTSVPLSGITNLSASIVQTDLTQDPPSGGNYFLLQTINNNANGYVYLGNTSSTYNMRITPNKKWLVSYYAKKASGATGVMRVYFRVNDGGHVGSQEIDVSSSEWQRYTFIVDCTIKPLARTAILRLDNDGLSGSSVYIDNIMIEVLEDDLNPIPSPYTPPFDQRPIFNFERMLMNLNAGVGSALSSNPLSAADVGSTTTISVAAHSLQFPGRAVSYNAGSITGLNFNTRYYVYVDDPYYIGGSVTYQVATVAQITNISSAIGRRYLGSITTPSNGGGPTAPPTDDCPHVDMWLTEDLQVKDVQVGDVLDGVQFGIRQKAKVTAVKDTIEDCVRITTESDYSVIVSVSTPIERITRDCYSAINALHEHVQVEKDGRLVWEKVTDVEFMQDQPVKHISLDNISFLSGSKPNQRIVTHNTTIKP